MNRKFFVSQIGGIFLALAFNVAPVAAQTAAFVNWESPQSHPIDITPNGLVVLAVNTADAQLEIFDVANGSLMRRGSIAVGLDPVSVRAQQHGSMGCESNL